MASTHEKKQNRYRALLAGDIFFPADFVPACSVQLSEADNEAIETHNSGFGNA